MMKRELIKMDRAQQQALTTKSIAGVLTSIMRTHIGFHEAITRKQLFKKLFKKDEEDTLSDWVRWEFAKKAMHHCRQRTQCFISSKFEDETWKYFVIKDYDDAQYYIDKLNRNIASMERMKERAWKAAEEQWWRKDWQIESKNTKMLGDKNGGK